MMHRSIHPIGLLKTQNTLYFIQAMYTGLEHEVLFPESLEASKHGVIIPEFHKKYIKEPSLALHYEDIGNKEIITGDKALVVDIVFDHYTICSNSRLRELVKEEKVWKEAFHNTDNKLVSYENMINHYKTVMEYEMKLMEWKT